MPPCRATVAARRAILALGRACFLGALSQALCGCAAGLVGAVLGILSVSSSGGGVVNVEPLRVDELRLEAPSTPDEILVRFKLAGGSGGRLSARIEHRAIAWLSEGGIPPALDWRPASLLPASTIPEDLAPGREARLLWDAKGDLDGRSARVELRVIPLEGGVPSEARSATARAGNTPPIVQRMELASRGDAIFVSFEVVDLESDPVELQEVNLIVEGQAFAMPADLFATLRKDYPSAPDPTGAQGTFSFAASRLDRPGNDGRLLQVGRPGFVGALGIRIVVRDWPGEEPTAGESSFDFDTNDPPFLSLQAVEAFQLEGGIIPIRFTPLDRQSNPARIDVEVDLAGDGKEFQSANEFPCAASSGTEGLVTDPEVARTYTFYWDAVSQARGDRPVTIRIRARDREEGDWSFQRLTLAFPTLVHVGEIPVGQTPSALAVGDFDGDGFPDAAVACKGTAIVSLLRGDPAGLTLAGAVACGVGPIALAAGDLDGDEVSDLIVVNETSQDAVFLRGVRGSGLEISEGGEPILLGGPPAAAAAGDFDGDGIADVAVSVNPRLAMGKVLEIRGVRDQAPVPAPVPVEVGRGPVALLAGELDGDGAAADLAVANRSSDTVSLLAGGPSGPGWGGLRPLGEPVLVGDGPIALVLADLDGDGRRDLIAACENSASLSVIRGSASGLDTSRVHSVLLDTDPPPGGSVAARPSALAAGDFDGDSIEDVAVAIEGRGQLIIVRGGEDPSSWRPQPPIEVGEQPSALVALDFNRDGLLDLVATDAQNARLFRLQGGPLGMGVAMELQAGLHPIALAVADFDGDGDLELLAANRESADVTHLRGESSGLGPARVISTGSRPVAVTTGDYDGDGFLDAVVANSGSSNVAFIRGAPSGLDLAAILDVDATPGLLTTGRFGGDAGPDLYPDVAVGSEDSPLVVFLKGGASGLERVRNVKADSLIYDFAPRAQAQGDFRGSGFDDLVFSAGSGYLHLLAGGPDGLRYAGAYIFEPGPRDPQVVLSMRSADFDGDGIAELVVANKGLNHLHYLKGGSGADPPLGPPRILDAGNSPVRLLIEDFDGDGSPDIASANNGSGDVTVLRGSQGGLVLPGKNLRVGDRPESLAAGDFDGDGLQDAAVACRGSGAVSWLRGGPGGLRGSGRDPLRAGDDPAALASGDFDGDGFVDVAAASTDDGTLTVLRGGREGLGLGRRFALERGNDPVELVSGDFDGDERLDALAVLRGAGSVAWFRQRYVVAHANRMVLSGSTAVLPDPRSPPEYRLEIAAGARFSGQVCLIPATMFPLPPPEGAGLAAVTGAVSILRETTVLEEPAVLTLRLRQAGGDLLDEALAHPERLQAVRREPSTGRGALVVPRTPVSIAELARGTAVSFPILGFGTYAVVLERSVP